MPASNSCRMSKEVPEPTEAMVEAGLQAIRDEFPTFAVSEDTRRSVEVSLAAAIAAAPPNIKRAREIVEDVLDQIDRPLEVIVDLKLVRDLLLPKEAWLTRAELDEHLTALEESKE